MTAMKVVTAGMVLKMTAPAAICSRGGTRTKYCRSRLRPVTPDGRQNGQDKAQKEEIREPLWRERALAA